MGIIPEIPAEAVYYMDPRLLLKKLRETDTEKLIRLFRRETNYEVKERIKQILWERFGQEFKSEELLNLYKKERNSELKRLIVLQIAFHRVLEVKIDDFLDICREEKEIQKLLVLRLRSVLRCISTSDLFLLFYKETDKVIRKQIVDELVNRPLTRAQLENLYNNEKDPQIRKLIFPKLQGFWKEIIKGKRGFKLKF